MRVTAGDTRLSWEGAVSLEQDERGIAPWRIPYQQRGLFPDVLVERAAMPAGVRLAFSTDATTFSAACEVAPEAAPVELLCDGELVGAAEVAGRDGFGFDGLPAGEKRLELWLPQFGTFRLSAVDFPDGASLAAAPDAGRRWVTYGSSITQCRTAAGPAQTWPAIAARERSLNLTCLGFGGQCHLDVMVARTMRALPADYLSMCVGINIYGAASLGPRAFRSAIVGFVQVVREGHPDAPYVVMSPICSPPRERTPNAVGFTLEAMRQEVALAVESLRAHGDANVHYVDGMSVFGADLASYLPDDLHPDAAGYAILGRNFARDVAAVYFG
ncbi:MAG TPA: GDSL-type esterase/lipase family protein [Chloroflexota bacterium]|nr:GDSL-type esterase/lipase family protein [Chloroflexota bacterium]